MSLYTFNDSVTFNPIATSSVDNFFLANSIEVKRRFLYFCRGGNLGLPGNECGSQKYKIRLTSVAHWVLTSDNCPSGKAIYKVTFK